MKVKIARADFEAEYDDLIELDKKIFPNESRTDFFENEWFRGRFEAWWVFVNGVRAGYMAFVRGITIDGEGFGKRDKRYLWIASTGLLPEFRGKGIGKQLKAWQITYARREGFKKLMTQCRVSNARMIGINKRFGFMERRINPGSFHNPTEDAIILELKL